MLVAPAALLACATQKAKAPATNTPIAEVAAAPASRAIDPFMGPLVSADLPTLRASCADFLTRAEEQIARLKGTKAEATDPYETIDLYDEYNAAVNQAGGLAGVVFNLHPDKVHRDAAEKCQQDAEALRTKVSLDRDVYDALAGIDLSRVDGETRYFVETELGYFRREGVDRDPATRAKVQQLEDELLKIAQRFERNINDDVRRVELDPRDLDGLPADWIAKHPVQPNGKVVVTTEYTDYFPFSDYAKSSAAREKLYRAFMRRAYPANMPVLAQLLEKRKELATIVGYPSYAAREMENKMIRDPKAARDFIDRVVAASESRSAADYALLLAELQKINPKARVVNRWDARYLKNRVRQTKFAFDAASVRPYFEFSRVKAGLMDVAATLFDVQFKPVVDTPVWSPDVEVYDVYQLHQLLGRVYLDLHPREGKYKHAAQSSLTGGKRGYRLPEGVLMCNFPKPGELMEHSEVTTFFHEFGHLIQHVLAGRARWINTNHIRERDFVEAPSQFLEEWVNDAPTLQRFALHYKTNEPIPSKLVEDMVRAEDFGRGLDVRGQMVFADASLQYYVRDPKALDTTAVFHELERKYLPYPIVDDTFDEASFGHLVGYSSNYYTYMWSLVIARDLLTPFKRAGMLDHDTAMRYRRSILELCGTRPPTESVKEFLGRPFGFGAFEQWLNRKG
jgi:thimet oligopeptidase